MSPERKTAQQEREQVSEYPYSCPECRTSLGEPGSVIVYIDDPEWMAGHVEPGEGNGINLIIDAVEQSPSVVAQCADCGKDLEHLLVEQILLNPECEVEEDDRENGVKE